MLLIPLLWSAVVLPLSHGQLSFLAIGDWGGGEHPPYHSKSSMACANGMGRVARDLDTKFVVSLGDNFYYHGIPGDASHWRFKATFEDVFTAESLQTPWYVIAGNHDHVGNVTAQIGYSLKSQRWTFPHLYHTWTEAIPGTSMTLQVPRP